jgi:hypothetical protein
MDDQPCFRAFEGNTGIHLIGIEGLEVDHAPQPHALHDGMGQGEAEPVLRLRQ